jgi:uncharacterized protein YraI
MHSRSRWGIWLLIGIVLLLAACDEVPASSPSSTRTVKPIVSFTPRFTATPIPSVTYTPSNTPVPTSTPVPPTLTRTPTPTATATVAGVVQSTENVNLREGPGENYPIVVSVSPGTTVGVLGVQTDTRGRDWYKVAYVDEDGEELRLWVYARLLDTDFDLVVAPATPTSVSPGTNLEPSPATRAPTPTREPNRVEILAYCHQKSIRPPRPSTADNVYVEWSWFVSLPEYMDQHLENANYAVRLDGRLLENWERYATDMRLEGGVWIIYWYYPVGKLEAGEHEITFELTWDSAISDGYNDFGPGTANETDEGNCSFVVTES